VPGAQHILYGMLEPVAYEARAPRGGVFHPKLWLIRFAADDGDVLIRQAVLSRNLTRDRSWDLNLVMDGEVGRKRIRGNKPLADLLAALPAMSTKAVQAPWMERLDALADELMHTDFELPGGFEELSFHLLGLGGGSWLPGESDELVVISPFVSENALEKLADTTRNPLALVSRQEELAGLEAAALEYFDGKYVLNENLAVSEEPEGTGIQVPLEGLHAKAYISRKGWYTSVAIGSANATDAAILHGNNVEILVELRGRHSRVGRPEDILGGEGLGEVLVPYDPDAKVDEAEASKRREADRILRESRKELCGAELRLYCSQEGDHWITTISARKGFQARMIEKAKAWLVTLDEQSARDITPVLHGGRVVFASCAAAHLTGFVAFEIIPNGVSDCARFVLNLPVEGMPEERDAAILRELIANKDGFLRYLLLLLGDIGEDGVRGSLQSLFIGWGKKTGGSWDDLPLLEELAAAACREPGRLRPVKKLIDGLLSTPEGRDMIPEDFLSLWRVFERSCLMEEACDA